MLRASLRILRPSGRTAFFTIQPAAGLTGAQLRRASRDGPIAVTATRPHRELLAAAGFTDVTETEFTTEFAAVTRAWIQQWQANYEDLVALLGEPAVQERQANRRAQLRAIEDGILSRSLFTARRPARVPRRRPGRALASAWPDEAAFVGEHDCLDAVSEGELGQDPADVRLARHRRSHYLGAGYLLASSGRADTAFTLVHIPPAATRARYARAAARPPDNA